jgi:membrane protein
VKWKLPDFKAWERWFWGWTCWVNLERWAKKKSAPGFFGVPIFNVFRFLIKEFQQFDLFTRANSISFSFFLSLFPSLIALFTLVPLMKRTFLSYLPEGENFDQYLQNEIKKIMPGSAGDSLFTFIEDITNNPRIGLLSVGFLSAVYFGSNGILSLMRAFDKIDQEVFIRWGFWKRRWVAITLTFRLGLLLIASVILIILGQTAIQYLDSLVHLNYLTGLALNVMRWVIIIALFYMSIALIYRNGASTRRKFRFFTPGAALASILCLLSSVLFSMYVDMFNTYNRLYGSIGAIIVIMLWIQLNIMCIIIGFELNASIAINYQMQQKIMEQEKQLEPEENRYFGA